MASRTKQSRILAPRLITYRKPCNCFAGRCLCLAPRRISAWWDDPVLPLIGYCDCPRWNGSPDYAGRPSTIRCNEGSFLIRSRSVCVPRRGLKKQYNDGSHGGYRTHQPTIHTSVGGPGDLSKDCPGSPTAELLRTQRICRVISHGPYRQARHRTTFFASAQRPTKTWRKLIVSFR